MVVLNDSDSASFAVTLPRRPPERTVVGTPAFQPTVLQVRTGAVRSSLAAAGLDLQGLRGSRTPVVRELPKLNVQIQIRDSVVSAHSAPNTVGVLEGTDPELKQEYLVYSAHMDHIGITPGRPDSINNGADDDASGTVGVVELAEAFSRPELGPNVDDLSDGERGGEGPLGQRLLHRAPSGADQADRRGHQHRHDRPELARHHRRDREGALRTRAPPSSGSMRPTASLA